MTARVWPAGPTFPLQTRSMAEVDARCQLCGICPTSGPGARYCSDECRHAAHRIAVGTLAKERRIQKGKMLARIQAHLDARATGVPNYRTGRVEPAR